MEQKNEGLYPNIALVCAILCVLILTLIFGYMDTFSNLFTSFWE